MADNSNDDGSHEPQAPSYSIPANREEAEANRQRTGWAAQSADAQASAAFDSEWASNPVRYEYGGDEGDIGPANENLEKILFSQDFRHVQGDHMANYDVTWKTEGADNSEREMTTRAVVKVRF